MRFNDRSLSTSKNDHGMIFINKFIYLLDSTRCRLCVNLITHCGIHKLSDERKSLFNHFTTDGRFPEEKSSPHILRIALFIPASRQGLRCFEAEQAGPAETYTQAHKHTHAHIDRATHMHTKTHTDRCACGHTHAQACPHTHTHTHTSRHVMIRNQSF